MKKLFAILLALVLSLSMLTLAVFAESTTEEEEDVNVPAVEENPETGVALAVIPAVVAAAAIALSKKR